MTALMLTAGIRRGDQRERDWLADRNCLSPSLASRWPRKNIFHFSKSGAGVGGRGPSGDQPT